MIRRTRILGLVALSLLLALAGVAVAQLPQKAMQTLDHAVSEFQAGRLAEALRLTQGILESTPAEQLQLADQRLGQQHGLDMTVLELATRARAEMVLDGQGGHLGRPGSVELPAALVALDDRMAQLLEPVRREIDIGFPAMIPDDVLTEKVATLSSLETPIEQAGYILVHLQQLTGHLPAAERAKLEPRAHLIASRKLSEEQKKLDDLRHKLTGRLVEFSLMRLNNATTVALDEAAAFQRRFSATARAGESLAVLHKHWDRYKRWKQKTARLDPSIETRWRTQEDQLRTRATPFLQKVYHFTEGSRWWLRGRFGQGPLGGGLAKVAASGARNDLALQGLLSSPLLMPQPIPKPQNPVNVPLPFPVARRHLEWWRLETRVEVPVHLTLSTSRPSESMASTSLLNSAFVRETASPSRLAFVAIEAKPEELRLAQLVGYVEYTTALVHFEQLLQLATPAELRTLDDMVGQDDRFVVHSNLSSKYDNLYPASTLRLANWPPDPRAKQANERRGLSWVMALARIEVGAMRAGHTGESNSVYQRVDNARRVGKPELLFDNGGPFEKWPPTAFEREAFLEILFDGARQHYYESRTEYQVTPAALQRANLVAQRIALFQLERKLTVAIEMVGAFRDYAAGSLSPTQQVELNQWLTRLNTQQGILRAALSPPVANGIAVQRLRDLGQAAPDQRLPDASPVKPTEKAKDGGQPQPPAKTKSSIDQVIKL